MIFLIMKIYKIVLSILIFQIIKNIIKIFN